MTTETYEEWEKRIRSKVGILTPTLKDVLLQEVNDGNMRHVKKFLSQARLRGDTADILAAEQAIEEFEKLQSQSHGSPTR